MWIIIGFTLVMKNAFVGKKAEKKPKRRAASKKCEKNPVPKEGPLGILLFVDRFLPYMDGVVRTVDAYAREMVAMGHNVAVVCPRGKTERKCGAPYRILHVPTVFLPFFKFPIAIPLRTKRIKRYFEENKVDVIHSHSPFIMGSLAKRLGKKYKIPVISSFHSKYYDDVLNITHSKIISRKVVDIIVGHYRSIDRVWACSEGAADTLRGYGYDKDIDVMINGVEKMPDGDREDLKNAAIERLSLPKDKKILLFVGQQIWHKNLKLVIDVSNNIKQTHPDTVTVIVGEGYNAESIKNYAKRVGASNVIFKGAVKDRSLLYGVYLSSHILFFPSVYDTSGLVIREAAMAGVPSLLVKGANTAEVVEDGVNGFLAENSEAAMTEKIKEILSLPDIGKTGENAAKTIPVTWDTIARAAVEKYRNGLT